MEKWHSQTFQEEEMAKSIFAMGNPKIYFIKNLNMHFTTTNHMKDFYKVLLHSHLYVSEILSSQKIRQMDRWAGHSTSQPEG